MTGSSLDLDVQVVGTNRRLAAAVVAGIAIAAVAIFGVIGLLEASTDGLTGNAVFAFVFGLLPLFAGVVCARWRLGYVAAALAGLTPGIVFLLVAAAGAALGLGSFGGGDSPLVPFSAILSSVGFVWASGGFALGLVFGIVRDRSR